jgi:glucose/arabinose dehydrogenase
MSLFRSARSAAARTLGAALLGVVLFAPASAVAAPEPFPGCRVVEAWPGVGFVAPLWVGNDGSSDFLYVAEQGGKVHRIAKNRTGAPGGAPSVFLDLSSKVTTKGQGGIAAVAFHPTYAQTGRLFVAYTAAAGTAFKVVLAEFKGQGARCDPASEKVLLEISKTKPLHNGGGILFGPDGKLWMGTGDNATDSDMAAMPNSLLGKVLRIDVDAASPPLPYGIPADNPWPKVEGVRPEIWGYGFRNAWRFCFDAQGAIWVASPGATVKEWVHKGVKGANHGWPFYEGTLANPKKPLPPDRASEKLEMPAWEYERAPGEASTAIVGGIFYRGDRIKGLSGKYVCGDYARGDVYVVDLNGDKSTRLGGKVPSMSSFGTDAQGEVYITSFEGGKVYTLAP